MAVKYKIPLFDLNYDKREERAVLATLRSRWISMGPSARLLEEVFAARLEIPHAVALTNCTTALHLALKVLNIQKGDEVIVPSLTFVASVNAVRYVDATPVFADITSLTDLSIDPNDIEKKITKKTKAVIVVHYGGFACDMERIRRIVKNHNLYLIEDAAHAPDTLYKNKKLGTWGDFGCFSFFSNKNMTCGEGGMLVTPNEEYAKKLRLLRSHGMTTLSYDRAKGHAFHYDVLELGYNYRLDDIRASLALAQLKKLPREIKQRMRVRRYYLDALSEIKSVIVPYQKVTQSSHYIFPVILKDSNAEKRNAVRQFLAQEGIETSVHYPAVHRFSIYVDYRAHLPKTDYAVENEITLPMFSSLKKTEVQYICITLKKALDQISRTKEAEIE